MGHSTPHFGTACNSKISLNPAVILRFFRTIDRVLLAIRDDIAIVIPYAIGLSAIVLASTDKKKAPKKGA